MELVKSMQYKYWSINRDLDTLPSDNNIIFADVPRATPLSKFEGVIDELVERDGLIFTLMHPDSLWYLVTGFRGLTEHIIESDNVWLLSEVHSPRHLAKTASAYDEIEGKRGAMFVAPGGKIHEWGIHRYELSWPFDWVLVSNSFARQAKELTDTISRTCVRRNTSFWVIPRG